ncbi:MAG TPA: serine protease [Conexibacter sp.]
MRAQGWYAWPARRNTNRMRNARIRRPRRTIAGRWGGLVAAVVLLLGVAPAGAAAADGGTLSAAAGRAQADSGGTLGAAEQPPVAQKPAIVGGTPIAASQAPWQAFVQADTGTGIFELCGGSVIDATHVVTAGHCAYNSTTVAPFSASAMLVAAGASNTKPLDATAQVARVTAIRVHPFYEFTAQNQGVAPDDVAVLQLTTPLDLSGVAPQSIPLTAAGVNPPPGSAATISGFGLQMGGASEPDGKLYAVGTTVVDPLRCGRDANAVVTCISSAVGSACQGDSGGPLTIGGALAGVASFITTGGPTGICGIGSINGYTNVAAPDVQQFIAGNDDPPRAPRGGSGVTASAPAWQAGSAMTCAPGAWSGSPTFTFTFLDTRTGQALQSGGAATFGFTNADAGRTVACQVAATNAGGTGIARTEASPPIASSPGGAGSSGSPGGGPAAGAGGAPTGSGGPGARGKGPAGKPVLRLTVRVPPNGAPPGSAVTLTIRVANRGGEAATGVVVCNRPGRALAFPTAARGSAAREAGSAQLPVFSAHDAGRRVCRSLGTVNANSGRTLRLTLAVSPTAKAGQKARDIVVVRSSEGGSRSEAAVIRIRPNR